MKFSLYFKCSQQMDTVCNSKHQVTTSYVLLTMLGSRHSPFTATTVKARARMAHKMCPMTGGVRGNLGEGVGFYCQTSLCLCGFFPCVDGLQKRTFSITSCILCTFPVRQLICYDMCVLASILPSISF